MLTLCVLGSIVCSHCLYLDYSVLTLCVLGSIMCSHCLLGKIVCLHCLYLGVQCGHTECKGGVEFARVCKGIECAHIVCVREHCVLTLCV